MSLFWGFLPFLFFEREFLLNRLEAVITVQIVNPSGTNLWYWAFIKMDSTCERQVSEDYLFGREMRG